MSLFFQVPLSVVIITLFGNTWRANLNFNLIVIWFSVINQCFQVCLFILQILVQLFNHAIKRNHKSCAELIFNLVKYDYFHN